MEMQCGLKISQCSSFITSSVDNMHTVLCAGRPIAKLMEYQQMFSSADLLSRIEL